MSFGLFWVCLVISGFPGYTLNPLHVPVISGDSCFSASAQPSHNSPLNISCSCHFRTFPLLQPSYNCYSSCSCHFRALPDSSDSFRFGPLFSQLFPFMFLQFSDFTGFFRFGQVISQVIPFMFVSFPDFSRVSRCFRFRTTRLTTAPFHVPVISGFFRRFPDLSGRHTTTHYATVMSTVFPDVSDVFRTCPAVANVFPFMFLSFQFWIFPDFPDVFRICPAATKNVPFPVRFISGFFQIFPTSSGVVRPSQQRIGPLVV